MLAHIVREAARRFGDRPAFVAEAGWILSYRELDRLSDEAAAGLSRAGVGPGHVVPLLLPSSPDYAVAYAAAAKLGAVTAGVNPRLAPAERATALAVVQPDAVLSTGDLAHGVAVGAAITEVPLAGRPDELLGPLRVRGGTPADLPPDPDRPVAIVLTSGTTGVPKGALFAERQLEAIARIDGGDGWGGGGPMLASTELAHIGFMTKLPWYLRAGMRVHLLTRWRPGDALRIIAEQRIASVGGIAAQFALMLREPGFDHHDLSAVRTLVAGGGPSSPALVREARRRFGAGYSIRYSSTESGGVGTMTAFDADDEEVATVGRARMGVEIAIRDEHGKPLAMDEVGDVWIRSPAVMTGYWRDPEATSGALVDGWLRTGDLGTLDRRGCLRLHGRRDAMYVRGGYNVYPEEVEAVLASHPGVSAVAVVPRADPVMGQIGVAVIVPVDPSRPPALDELREFGRHRLAGHKLPEAVRVVRSLPLTSIHKLDRPALRRLADQEPAATP
jgi:acyl-CoA synthetase (AMP-forming)/AMP-acid ligase II